VKSAAIYARVSSDRQREDHSIDSQLAVLREYAQAHGYVVAEEWIFADEGYSGATLVRPGLERLRDLAVEGQLEAVLVLCPDRLSRRYAYQVLLIEELARHGVAVVFAQSVKATTPEEQLLVHFQGMIAEYERAQIAERTRRGKKHRAKAGSVNVLSGAPYGYRYVKKTDGCPAYYEVLEPEAEIVRKVFGLYTEHGLSIAAIARWLQDRAVPTRRGAWRWERSVVWGMLRNPAYQGRACFGKTEQTQRQKVTRRLRLRGGYSPRCSSNRARPREEWIEIAVPAIVSEEIFALAAEQLEQNKRFSARRTIEPTLLQGMLVCGQCGYALYRSSTRTSKRRLYYYRCIGSDAYRHRNGPVCSNRPIRQDHLDEVVWKQIIELLEEPDLIRVEIERRVQEIQDSAPAQQRKEVLSRELARAEKAIRKILDAYQEGLVELGELRQRMPELRKGVRAMQSELQSMEVAAADRRVFLRLAHNIEGFLERLRASAQALSVTERQKVLRLVAKEIVVYPDTIKIRHSIPTRGSGTEPEGFGPPAAPGYLLRSGSQFPDPSESLLQTYREVNFARVL
jgi:site-specific DNA recombinase